MNISVSNIQSVYIAKSDLKGNMLTFIKDLNANGLHYDIHENKEIELVFFDDILNPGANERLEVILKKHVRGFSKVSWKNSPLNCKISNFKSIVIRDLQNSLTIPLDKFKKKVIASELKYSDTNHSFMLYFKKPSILVHKTEKYTANFEHVLSYVKTIADINWQ